MHGQVVQALDWTYDNSQLLSVGADASLCVWDVADPADPTCIRSISCPATSFLCGRCARSYGACMRIKGYGRTGGMRICLCTRAPAKYARCWWACTAGGAPH